MAITRNQALELFRSDDLIGLGMEADTLRQSLHPEGVVTYILDRSIHYACFCSGYCSFCESSHGRSEAAQEGYVLNFDTIYAEVAEAEAMGGTGVSLRGGQHADLKLEWFERLLQGIRQRFPRIWLQCFSAPEILAIAKPAGLTIRDTISRLRDAGLDSITGSAAEILDDDVRRLNGWQNCSTEDWVSVHRTAHKLGMRTAATMVFGLGETFEQRINHFELVRRLQETTGGFTAFIPGSFRPNSGAEKPTAGGNSDQATSIEYLKTLAISRLYLDNIENVQSSGEAQGLKVLQLGLRFGGNDAGSALEESLAWGGNAVSSGRGHRSIEEELRRVIRDAGFEPAQRDSLYTTCFLD
jgi:cyclic dehypoxanthinyl futalosine synthase